MNRKVSVIIPTYNYGRFIKTAIESVQAQTYPIHEIIVVDDGSSDETAEVVTSNFPEVKYIRQKNSGVCAARNKGVENSTGEFIAFLDADDIWYPEKIAKQMAKFGEDQEIGLVHCGMREFDNRTNETIRLYIEGAEGWVADDLLLFEKPVIAGCGGAIVITNKAFNKVGGFDTNLIVGEDWDFCYRIAREFKVGFVQEILADYRNHGKNAHANVAEMERSMGIFYEKAFRTDDRKILRLRRRAYGNFHQVLAGSYFQAQNYSSFLYHSLKSLWLTPQNISRYLTFPVRILKRRFSSKTV